MTPVEFRFLTAKPDGSNARIVLAKDAAQAALLRSDADHLRGVVAVWRLGNFPTQFDITDDPDHPGFCEARYLGNPSVKEATT